MKEKEFISKWTSSLTNDGIKNFPEDFLANEELNEIALPGKTLITGKEFFGSYEVLTVDGAAVLQAESQSKAKYIAYSSRSKKTVLKIPQKEEEIRSVVSKYENYLDSLIKEIESDYRKSFPGEKRSNTMINEIFRVLNLNRY